MTAGNDHLHGLNSEGGQECNRIIALFEEAWRHGRRPGIGDFLPAQTELRQGVLLELVHIDLEHRLRLGEPARTEEYLTRYPELSTDRRAVLALIVAEYELRRGQPGVNR